jgi:hypothetical protein
MIEALSTKILDMLEVAPHGGRAPLDWTTYVETPLGLALKASEARLKLRRGEEPLTSDEVCLLSGWNAQKLASAKLIKGGKKGTQYDAASVREAFEKDGVRV